MTILKDVLTVMEYKDKNGETKAIWTKIGTFFTSETGESIVLDALPLSNRLIIKDRKPKEQTNTESKSQNPFENDTPNF